MTTEEIAVMVKDECLERVRRPELQKETEEYEYKWFWEVDGIYDLENDLLIESLMGVLVFSFEESMLYGNPPLLVAVNEAFHN